MTSVRKKIKENVNASKNTRMDIRRSGLVGDWRADILAHMSRYDCVANYMMTEAKRLGRPIGVLDVGCGEFWPLRIIFHAYLCPKPMIIGSYTGVDIEESNISNIMSEEMAERLRFRFVQQDLTLDPSMPVELGSVDFAFSLEVIEHMKSQFVPAWLDGMDEALVPGGLVFISTPNRDGSNEQLPKDHVYEWGYQELRDELESRWSLVDHFGTFIRLPDFYKANKRLGRVPEELVEMYKGRFGNHWLRNVLAVSYPECSNNVCWVLRKPHS